MGGKAIYRDLSGHFSTNSYLERFKIKTDKKCKYCRKSEETIDHILVECPRFSSLRSHNFLNSKIAHSPTVAEFLSSDKIIPLAAQILKIVAEETAGDKG